MNKKDVWFDPFSVEIEESTKVSEILDYSDIISEISKALINYRKVNSLTQLQLSKILNMKQSMVSKLESGEYNATLKMLLKISYILENDSSFFIEIIENIRKLLIRKKQFNEVNSNKDYSYKMSNDNKKIYCNNYYIIMDFDEKNNSESKELKYSYKIS